MTQISDESVRLAAEIMEPGLFEEDQHSDNPAVIAAREIVSNKVRAALTAALQGSVVVPREATWEMDAAARVASWPYRNIYGEMDDLDKDIAAGEIWRLMVDEALKGVSLPSKDVGG
ncbi:hypothetical protein [Tardiphaga sp. 839_C3_N1_4]|uniref:hypothetical protein n=1 Tax=Tardiphaga sp. 839_C3_N1_4 TaxID=3240761 RepID=UPI003F2212B9